MIKSVEERVLELVEPKAAKAREEYYAQHNVPDESLFWSNPVAELEQIIERQLRTKSHQTVTISNIADNSLGLAVPELNRIQITAEVLADFRRILQRQHGQIVVSKQAFNQTADFTKHHYLRHLWRHLESSAEWMLYQAKCDGTIWDGSKLTYRSIDTFKLIHNDGCAACFQLPAHEESLIQVFYFNVPVERQVGLVGAKRFKQLHNLMIKDTKHPAMISPCLMTDDEATPIGRKEWRFDGYGRGADDITRLMAYWMRLGAVRPMFDGEPRDMLWFANQNHALKFKELLTEATGVNPYNLISKRHSIYDEEFAGKLKCD